jgi:hypothetical protein
MKIRLTGEQLAKLPRWARLAIQGYESDIQALERAMPDAGPSDTWVVNFTAPSYSLPEGQRVRFYLDLPHTDTNDADLHCLDVRRLRDNDGAPYVEVAQPWGDSPRVEPQSGNVLRVYVQRRGPSPSGRS